MDEEAREGHLVEGGEGGKERGDRAICEGSCEEEILLMDLRNKLEHEWR